METLGSLLRIWDRESETHDPASSVQLVGSLGAGCWSFMSFYYWLQHHATCSEGHMDSNDPGNSTEHASFKKQLLPHKTPYSLSSEEVNGNSPNENKQREFIDSSLQQGRWPPSLGSNSGSVRGVQELPLGKREGFRCALIEAVGLGNWSNWLEAKCPGKSDWQQVGFLGWLNVEGLLASWTVLL